MRRERINSALDELKGMVCKDEERVSFRIFYLVLLKFLMSVLRETFAMLIMLQNESKTECTKELVHAIHGKDERLSFSF